MFKIPLLVLLFMVILTSISTNIYASLIERPGLHDFTSCHDLQSFIILGQSAPPKDTTTIYVQLANVNEFFKTCTLKPLQDIFIKLREENIKDNHAIHEIENALKIFRSARDMFQRYVNFINSIEPSLARERIIIEQILINASLVHEVQKMLSNLR